MLGCGAVPCYGHLILIVSEVFDAQKVDYHPRLRCHHCGGKVCDTRGHKPYGPLRDGWAHSFITFEAWFEVTVFQLEKIYGRSKESQEFIASLIQGCLAVMKLNLYQRYRGQKGLPHPQAGLWSDTPPKVVLHLSSGQALNNAKARMYKVLREIVDENVRGTMTSTEAPWQERMWNL